MDRLQKVIARGGLCSRRKAEELIRAGRVRVNGKTVTGMGAKVDPDRDQVEVDGRFVEREQLAYFVLHKPGGVVTTAEDPEGRKTVVELLSAADVRLFPVGRLDYNTEGLLVLTNDGELAHRLTHPSYEIEKAYIADLEGSLTDDALDLLRRGVNLEDGRTAPAGVRLVDRNRDGTRVEMTIHEGRNRQIRRMAEAVGFPVRRLKRIRVGPLTLGKLSRGTYRRLDHEEVIALKRAVLLL